jgi:L-alanine-DL-glutamate epimerase-like enolase superfamily enzyme
MKMAGVVIDAAENLLVRVQADNGSVGWGESASAPTMTGELLPGMAAAVAYLAPQVLDADLDSLACLAAIAARCHRALHGNASAHAAIDMALHDLLGQALQQPVHALLGTARRARVPVLWMLGTGRLNEDVAEALDKAAQGCLAFKLKVGAEAPQADAERTRAVRAALGNNVLLCADANQGWTLAQAQAYLAALGGTPLDFLEQPLHGEDLQGMQQLAASTRVPIGCDEGIHSLADIRAHHALHAAAGCSLKLIKLGGLRQILDAANACATMGMQVNLACKVAESSIASAAVLHLAAVLPGIAWGLSLSTQYLADDVVLEPVVVASGHAGVPSLPGLGMVVDEAQVARYRVRV